MSGKPGAERDTEIPLLRCGNVRHLNGETKTPDTKIGAGAAGNGYAKKPAGTTGAGIFTAFSLAAKTDDIDGFKGHKNIWCRGWGFAPPCTGRATRHTAAK